MKHTICQKIYITHIMEEFQCDVFMPEIDTNMFRLIR